MVDNIDLKKQLTLSDLEAIYWSLQTAVATNNENPVDKFKSYILHDDLINSSEIYNSIVSIYSK